VGSTALHRYEYSSPFRARSSAAVAISACSSSALAPTTLSRQQEHLRSEQEHLRSEQEYLRSAPGADHERERLLSGRLRRLCGRVRC